MNLTVSQALELIEIARCESHWNQSATHENLDKDGKIWTIDYGVFQISEHYWGEFFDKLGLDYKNNEQDNIEAGLMIYKQEGPTPWRASRDSCWLKS